MPAFAHRIQHSLDEYLALEEASNVKHEFFAGQIFAMAGGTPEHAALAAALIGLLFPQLRGGRCRLFDANLRIRIERTGLTTYPDVTVVCGPRALAPDDKNAVTNPTLIVEVTSPTSDSYDRGDKFQHYQTLSSLREYLLVSQSERRIERWTRDDAGVWVARTFFAGELVPLSSIASSIDVSQLYTEAADPP